MRSLLVRCVGLYYSSGVSQLSGFKCHQHHSHSGLTLRSSRPAFGRRLNLNVSPPKESNGRFSVVHSWNCGSESQRCVYAHLGHDASQRIARFAFACAVSLLGLSKLASSSVKSFRVEGIFSQSHKGASRRRARRRAVSQLGAAHGVALQFSRRGALLFFAPVQAWCFWLPWFCTLFFAVSACTILQAHCTSSVSNAFSLFCTAG